MFLISFIFYFLIISLAVVFVMSLFLLFTYSFLFIFVAAVALYLFMAILKKGFFVIYPIIEFFAKMFGINLDRVKRAVIDYSNHNMSKMLGFKTISNASQILIVLPHCIQNSVCLHKVTWDKIDNCKFCGKCCIPKFLELKKIYGVDVAVVSGGSAAREIIKQKNPKAVIAVACENDLVSGLRDVRGVPVFAVLNQRPAGPCRDTTVDVEAVKEYIKRLIGGSLK